MKPNATPPAMLSFRGIVTRGEEGGDSHGVAVPIDLDDCRQHQHAEDEFAAPVRAEGFEFEYCSVLGTRPLGASREPFLPALIQAFAATASDTMSNTGLMSVSRETRAGSVVSMTKVSLVP